MTAQGEASHVPASPFRTAARHVLSTVVMLIVMWPSLIAGHATIAAIVSMFVLFIWAAVAAIVARRAAGTARSMPRDRVADPFAMAVLMAVPYLVALGGHAHSGQSSPAFSPSATAPTAIASAAVIIGWALLRCERRQSSLSDPGFWICLGMMLCMLASGHAAT